MATKTVKEIVTDVGGNVSVEYSDDSTSKFNIADAVTASTNPLTGGIELSVGGEVVEVGGGGYTPLPLNARIVNEGDSLTDYENANSQNWQLFFYMHMGGRFYRPAGSNLAVGGQKISNLLGDGTWVADSSQIAAVNAKYPDLVTLLAGTNDIGGGITNEALIFPFFKTAISGYFDGGAKYVIVGKIPPRNSLFDTATPWTAAKEIARVRLNDLIATLPAWDKRVLVADTDVDNIMGSWDLATTNTTFASDGVHPNWVGFRIIGYAFYLQAIKLFGGVSPVTSGHLSSDNLLTNAMLWGTAGSKAGSPMPTGEVADSWTVANNMTGVNVVASKSTLMGATAQQMVLSGTPTAGNALAQFQINQTYSGLAEEGYELMCDYELAAGHSNIRNIYISCDTSQTPAAASTVALPSDMPLIGTIRTKLVTPLAAGDVSNSVRIYVVSQAAGVALSATIKISRPYLRKITAAAPQ